MFHRSGWPEPDPGVWRVAARPKPGLSLAARPKPGPSLAARAESMPSLVTYVVSGADDIG